MIPPLNDVVFILNLDKICYTRLLLRINGFSRVRFERLILNKELRDNTIKGLLEIGSLE